MTAVTVMVWVRWMVNGFPLAMNFVGSVRFSRTAR